MLVEKILAKPAETFPLSLVEAGHFPYRLCCLHACIILTGEFLPGIFFPLSLGKLVLLRRMDRAVGETEESAVMARWKVLDLRVSSMIVRSRSLQLFFFL